MSDNLSVFARINDEHTPAFHGAVSWYSNGARGHLHASSYCTKIDRKRASTVHTLTLGDALARTVCGDCISHGAWNDEQRSVFHAAVTLVQTEFRISRPQAEFRDGNIVGPLQDVRLRAFAERLRLEVLDRGQAPGLHAWSTRVLDMIEQLTPETVAPEVLQAECLRISAPALITQRLSRDRLPVSFWGGVLDENSPLGVARSLALHNGVLGRFARSWLNHVAAGTPPDEAADTIIAKTDDFVSLVGEPGAAALMRCDTSVAPNPGESVWSYSVRRWREVCEQAFRDSAAGMRAYHAELVAPKPYVLVANRNQGGVALRRGALNGDTQRLLAAAQQSFSHNEKCVIHCHPTVAAYITGDRDNYGAGEWSTPVVAAELPPDDVLETALALWDPWAREGSYREFAEALAAAKVL